MKPVKLKDDKGNPLTGYVDDDYLYVKVGKRWFTYKADKTREGKWDLWVPGTRTRKDAVVVQKSWESSSFSK